jgi:acetyl-CoA acetyltransferase
MRSLAAMRIVLAAMLFATAVSALHGGELEHFWSNFPGFKNTLESYGYDRNLAASAKAELVDAVIEEIAQKFSEKERVAGYLCVLYQMNPQTVASRLETLGRSSSSATRTAVAAVRQRLKDY